MFQSFLSQLSYWLAERLGNDQWHGRCFKVSLSQLSYWLAEWLGNDQWHGRCFKVSQSQLSYWLAEKLGNDQPTNSMADVSKLLSSKLLRRKSLIMLNEKMTIFLPHQLKRFFFLSWPYIVMAAVAWLHNDQVASSLQKARAGHETPQRLYSNISPGGEVHILASGVCSTWYLNS